MYEAEANTRTEHLDQVSHAAIMDFAGLKGHVLTRTVLPWGEHCTECVWPSCYSTCDLYTPRMDGGCRRFLDGMVRVECPESLNGYLLKIRFKKWAKLWTPGNIHLYPLRKADRIENNDHRIGTLLHQLPMPAAARSVLVKKRYDLKKHIARRHFQDSVQPTAFVLECFNPTAHPIPLSVVFRSARKEDKIPSQHLVWISSGFTRVRIPYEQVASVLDCESPFGIEILPASESDDITLFFGLMDFVQELERASTSASAIKCVVWDLDNTLWDGVLAEDGSSGIQLRPKIRDLLTTLDHHGILQSIASKNDHEQTIHVLTQLNLEHFFLYPQISWSPKGGAMHAIARQLNISPESILFIDDSEFELEQVRASCPGIRCLNAARYESLFELNELRAPVTVETSNRRSLYRVEQHRKAAAETFKDDYKAFLSHCNIALTINTLQTSNLERVHELAQRTNQMNFSGTRYDRDLLGKVLATPHLDTYVLSCEDKFGTYGIVGFGIVDRREPRLTDLMFSCRIQAKRIEHAFLAYILKRYIGALGTDFHADYRKTPRNAVSGKVFVDLGMQETGVRDGVTCYSFAANCPIPEDGVISIKLEQEPVLLERDS